VAIELTSPSTGPAEPTIRRTSQRLRARREHELTELSELCKRLEAMRIEAFDLVRELSARDARRGGDLERASVALQSIANQLAGVQTLAARSKAS
jgi:citrate lyase beta subunit